MEHNVITKSAVIPFFPLSLWSSSQPLLVYSQLPLDPYMDPVLECNIFMKIPLCICYMLDCRETCDVKMLFQPCLQMN